MVHELPPQKVREFVREFVREKAREFSLRGKSVHGKDFLGPNSA